MKKDTSNVFDPWEYKIGDTVMLKTFIQLIKEFDYKKHDSGWGFYKNGYEQINRNEIFYISIAALKYLGKEYKITETWASNKILLTYGTYLLNDIPICWEGILLYQADFYKEIEVIKKEIGI
jgi:hypothetical protein